MSTTTQPHVDRWNRDSNALLIGLTHHTEGGLWVEAEGGTCYEEFEDVLIAGHVLATSGTGVLFNSRSCLHATQTWAGGNRIVLIAYSVGRASYMSEALRDQLLELGFVPPMPIEASAESLPFAHPCTHQEPAISSGSCAVELSTAGCAVLIMVTGIVALIAEFRMDAFIEDAAAMSNDFGEWMGSAWRFSNLSA